MSTKWFRINMILYFETFELRWELKVSVVLDDWNGKVIVNFCKDVGSIPVVNEKTFFFGHSRFGCVISFFYSTVTVINDTVQIG